MWMNRSGPEIFTQNPPLVGWKAAATLRLRSRLPDSPNKSIDLPLAETNQGRATTPDYSAPTSVAFPARH